MGLTSDEEKEKKTPLKSRDWLIQVGTNHHSPERYANVFARLKHC
jgi:hypothetical protein